jgi:hypothetical protein
MSAGIRVIVTGDNKVGGAVTHFLRNLLSGKKLNICWMFGFLFTNLCL